MARVSGMDDMFGHVPQAGELQIEDAPVVTRGPIVHTRETIRALVLGLIDDLRKTSVGDPFPWNPRNLYGNRGMWSVYMEWFDNDTAATYTAQFQAELTRLGKALVNGPFNMAWVDDPTLPEIEAETESLNA
jgi:hypothetical protein